MRTLIYTVGIAVILMAGIYVFNQKQVDPEIKDIEAPEIGKYDSFAQCLAEKKVTMYGAAWCSHCKRQKALFGSSFDFVPYIECPENEKLCIAKGVTGYPTWIGESGEKLVGEQSMKKLSEFSGCELPAD